MSGGTVGNAVFFRGLLERLYEEVGKFTEKFKKNSDFIYDKEYDKVSVEENQNFMNCILKNYRIQFIVSA